MAWFNERNTTWCAHLSDALLGTLANSFGFIVVDNFGVKLHFRIAARSSKSEKRACYHPNQSISFRSSVISTQPRVSPHHFSSQCSSKPFPLGYPTRPCVNFFTLNEHRSLGGRSSSAVTPDPHIQGKPSPYSEQALAKFRASPKRVM